MTDYVVIPCRTALRRTGPSDPLVSRTSQLKFELIVPSRVCDMVERFLRLEVLPEHRLTICVDVVDAIGTNVLENRRT